MTLLEAIADRHSVRKYIEKPIEAASADVLNAEIERCNAEGKLHMQLVQDEPKAFSTGMAHYGKFSGVTSYIVLAGPSGSSLDERLGYYGERVVLLAQTLGLNTCWVGLTFSKVPSAFTLAPGEKVRGVIAIGYGETKGVQHHGKTAADVSDISDDSPAWYADGISAALLAPTAVNQQKFKFSYNDGVVSVKAGLGFFAKMDLGIVEYHFEVASGKKIFNL